MPDYQNYPAKVVFDRHPSEYRLIAKEGSDFDHPLHGCKNLFRIIPGHTLPEGYIEVTKIRDISVFEHDGKLKPQFMGLQRMIGLDKIT